MLKIVWPPLFVPFAVETVWDELGWNSEPTTDVLYRSPGAVMIPYEWHFRNGWDEQTTGDSARSTVSERL